MHIQIAIAIIYLPENNASTPACAIEELLRGWVPMSEHRAPVEGLSS